MTEKEFHDFQRQELTVIFNDGTPLRAPMSVWLGALIQELPNDKMQSLCRRVLLMRDRPPVSKAKLHLPPSMQDLENACNGKR